MTKPIHGSVCLNHPNMPAVARCATCSKPICGECVKVFDGVTYCSKLCYENALRTGMLTEKVYSQKATGDRRRTVMGAIKFIVIVIKIR